MEATKMSERTSKTVVTAVMRTMRLPASLPEHLLMTSEASVYGQVCQATTSLTMRAGNLWRVCMLVENA